MNVPLGPVAVFAASNFPFAFGLAGGDTGAAWAAGCPVVVKAHRAHPHTSEMFGRILTAAAASVGAPDGWFALVQGPGNQVGTALVAHASIKAVGFTGSFDGGMALARTAAGRPEPIPVYAEMGSVNPLFVTPGPARARGPEIATDVATVLTSSAGQLCTKPSTIYLIDDGPGRSLVTSLAEKLASAAPSPMLYEGLRAGFREAVGRGVGDERTGVLTTMGADDGPGSWQSPALLEVSASSLSERDPLLEEMFGPAAIVVWCRDEAELLSLAGVRAGSLTATIHAEPGEPIADTWFALAARWAGRLIYNDYPTGVAVGWATVHGAPFPATTSSLHTSVGMTSTRRFMRPVGYQGLPDRLLPEPLQNANPLRITRLVDGVVRMEAIK